jgi:hypothetical protein
MEGKKFRLGSRIRAGGRTYKGYRVFHVALAFSAFSAIMDSKYIQAAEALASTFSAEYCYGVGTEVTYEKLSQRTLVRNP